MLIPYDLVIFDLDGVLVDACEWHRLALNQALKEVCNYEISLEDHYNEYNGIPTKKKLIKLIDKGIISSFSYSSIYILKQQLTIDIIEKNCKPREEKIKLLNWLRERDIKTACFTNSIRETAIMMLKNTGIYDLFDVVITNEDVVEPKPDPEGYYAVLDLLKAEPKKTLIIEDSPKGLAAAHASGCTVVKVSNPDEVDINLLVNNMIYQ